MAWWIQASDWTYDEAFGTIEEAEPYVQEFLSSYLAAKQASRSRDGLHQCRKFVPPGRIIYLHREKQLQKSCCKESRVTNYAAVYVPANFTVASGLIISKRMLSDHLPDIQHNHLRKCIRKAEAATRVDAQH